MQQENIPEGFGGLLSFSKGSKGVNCLGISPGAFSALSRDARRGNQGRARKPYASAAFCCSTGIRRLELPTGALYASAAYPSMRLAHTEPLAARAPAAFIPPCPPHSTGIPLAKPPCPGAVVGRAGRGGPRGGSEAGASLVTPGSPAPRKHPRTPTAPCGSVLGVRASLRAPVPRPICGRPHWLYPFI